MNTARLLSLALLAPLLAGCLTSSPQVTQSNEDRCAARGHKPDSKAFSDCIALIGKRARAEHGRPAQRDAGALEHAGRRQPELIAQTGEIAAATRLRASC